MRLPITDKFLWEFYNFLEKIGDINGLLSPRPWREVWCPELHKFRYEYEKGRLRKRFSQFIYYLKKNGYIKIKSLENKQGIILTKKGAEKVLKTKLRLREKRPRKDGKWQMVIFDIPERKRDLRDLFRETLHILGYKMFQQSVWVCPYNVLKETEVIVQKYSLDRYVKLFLIEEVEM